MLDGDEKYKWISLNNVRHFRSGGSDEDTEKGGGNDCFWKRNTHGLDGSVFLVLEASPPEKRSPAPPKSTDGANAWNNSKGLFRNIR